MKMPSASLMRWKNYRINTLCRKEVCAISHKFMSKENLRAGCNICVAFVILGIIVAIFAETKALFMVAFIMVSISIGVGMVMAARLEHLRWENNDLHRNIEEQDKQDIENGKFNYVYEPEYLFFEYLRDNDLDLPELLSLIEDEEYPHFNISNIYEHYQHCEADKKHQTEEIIKNIIRRGKKQYDT